MKISVVVWALLIGLALGACTKPSATATEPINNPSSSQAAEPELERRLEEICSRAEGTVGVTVVHIESGKSSSVNGKSPLPLYSVFKLPLAIVVLKEVEENRLRLEQPVHVTPEDIVPGTPDNTSLWVKPVDKTIAELMELSIARSDNTSTDKLLQLVGGTANVTQRMRSLGFDTLDIHSSVAEYVKRRNPNTGSSDDMASLLVQLHQGKLLQPEYTKLLIGFMQNAVTGLKRLRGDLPSPTLVAHKTGSGEKSSTTNFAKATNDVGLITLPSTRGTIAIAVLMNDSKLPDASQEKVIAELARAAYDFYNTRR